MQIISLNNHIVRKALCLSLNEMAVLCDIKQMSQDQKFGYTCIKSKDKIAEWLDLSRTTVFTIIDTLIKKGLIEKNEIGLKPTSFVYQLDMCQEEIGLWLKNGGIELVTKKIQDLLTPCTDSTDSVLPQSSFCTQVYNIDNKKEKSNKKKEFVPPTYEEVKAFFIENQEPLEKLDKCFTYYNDANWTNRDGKKVKDWKRTIKTNWFSKNKNRDGHHNVPPAAPSRKLHESFNFKITNNDI
jgi:predicted transcriptional regulator